MFSISMFTLPLQPNGVIFVAKVMFFYFSSQFVVVVVFIFIFPPVAVRPTKHLPAVVLKSYSAEWLCCISFLFFFSFIGYGKTLSLTNCQLPIGGASTKQNQHTRLILASKWLDAVVMIGILCSSAIDHDTKTTRRYGREFVDLCLIRITVARIHH